MRSVIQRRKPERVAPTALEVVTAFFDAVEARDFERAQTLLSADNFSYEGPIEKHRNAAAFIQSISRFGTILESLERRRIFVDGDEVCALMKYETSIESIESMRIAHWLRVEQGKITRIESFFDARGYAAMFDTQD